jgi:multiple antibiotic resistance protein
MMGQAALAVNFFVALFALIDPVGNIPLFAAATVGIAAPARRRIALYIALFAFVFLTFFYFTGVGLLQYFGISMPAFRIAGGIMLFLLGLEMARDDFTAKFEPEAGPGDLEAAKNPGRYARKHFERLIVPFGMPLTVLVAFVAAGVISKALGKIGMTIVVRVLGLVLCALAVQFIIVGLADATGGIIRAKAAHPY